MTSITACQKKIVVVAIEAEKLSYGGASYIWELFICDNRTILHGKKDKE